MRTLIVAFVIASTGPASAGPCAIRPLMPHAMTANATELPAGGGVVVALTELGGGWSTPALTDLSKTDLLFVDGAKATAPTIRILAPGLVVYEPPAGTTVIKLVDGKRTLASHPRTAAKPLLPAPVVTAIHYVSSSLPPGPRQSPSNSVTAQLTGARPETAIALILFAEGKPATWTTAFSYTGPKGPIELWRTAGRCELPIPGLLATPAGTKVTLAWVDAAGRLGAMSKQLVVGNMLTP